MKARRDKGETSQPEEDLVWICETRSSSIVYLLEWRWNTIVGRVEEKKSTHILFIRNNKKKKTFRLMTSFVLGSEF